MCWRMFQGIQLAAIFSPEHGVAGVLDTTQIGNSTDAATGVPVYSVYGDTDAKRRPTAGAARRTRRNCLRHSGHWRALLHLREHAWIFS